MIVRALGLDIGSYREYVWKDVDSHVLPIETAAANWDPEP